MRSSRSFSMTIDTASRPLLVVTPVGVNVVLPTLLTDSTGVTPSSGVEAVDVGECRDLGRPTVAHIGARWGQ